MRTSSSTGEIQPRPLFEGAILKPALWAALGKLNPLHQLRNPVMFTVWVCSALTTLLWAQATAGHGEAPAGFILAIAVWLWFTWSSPTSPRPWPKAAARPRPTACASRART